MIDLNKALNENDYVDFVKIVNSINCCDSYMRNMVDPSFTLEQAEKWYLGIARLMVESRVNEHLWRLDISDRYEVPYDFVCIEGDLFLNDTEEYEGETNSSTGDF